MTRPLLNIPKTDEPEPDIAAYTAPRSYIAPFKASISG